jgi:hypothetical protein
MTSAIRFRFSACARNLRLPAAVSRQYFGPALVFRLAPFAGDPALMLPAVYSPR